jgi:cation:H+ antiporter
VSQWTLAFGSLPIAYLAGAGNGPLVLMHRELIEELLTMGQGLLAVATLATLRLADRDAFHMIALFALQIAVPSTLVRAALTVVYLMLAVDRLRAQRGVGRSLVAVLIPRPSRRP